LGSLDPPLRTTFFGGGQGFRAAVSAFFDAGLVNAGSVDPGLFEPGSGDPGLVGSGLFDSGWTEPALFDVLFAPASAEFAESAGLPTAVFSAVGASEQFGEVFL
jgi:hypothetical protein